MGTDLPLARSRLLFWYCNGTRASGCHTGIQLLLLLDTNATLEFALLSRTLLVQGKFQGSKQRAMIAVGRCVVFRLIGEPGTSMCVIGEARCHYFLSPVLGTAVLRGKLG